WMKSHAAILSWSPDSGYSLFFQALSMKRILLLCALVTSAVCGAAERNVIFFITDDESPTLGCYGDTCAVTPHIDALAA
ncbi:MAG TPA: hypothetical protein DCG12_09970, partial [Planctomycetaceae bacterium]|nr:hypothetical protein [Planctomycetaceae bacterium]